MPREHRHSQPLGRRFYCAAAVCCVCACVCACLALPGCAPDAASNNLTESDDAVPANRVLSPEEQAAVVRAMASTAEGHPTRPLAAAAGGYRWSDVPAALAAAASHCGLATSATSRSAEEVVASLVLPDGQRGRAVATQGPSAVTVQVSIGTFGDAKAEAEFTRAFNAALARLGRVRKPQPTATAGAD